ncbi:MAG: hypothetical protein IV086_17555 [Hyphomonadaceae bacterium]|nr:MAG: hypothetical protein FD160_1668 [Caulobacteraceae bacterium]MBT9447511.1 hypothetical protein [Hyphomonadaceae bacterium]
MAHAGAWVAPNGDRTIVGAAYGETEEASTVETDLFIEAPLNSRISVVANHWSQTVTTFEGTETGNESVLSGKYRLLRGDRSVVSVQGGVVWDSRASGECGEWGGEARLLVGAATRSGRVFVSGELGARTQGNDCVHARYDLTVGVKPHRRLLGLVQVFVDDDLIYGETLKAQASAVVFERNDRGVQLGVRMRLDAGEFIEPTILLSYWSALRR